MFAQRFLRPVFATGFVDRSAVLVALLFCYPFVISSIFVLNQSATLMVAGRLAVALVFNLVWSFALVCLLRAASPVHANGCVRFLLSFFSIYTFIASLHYLLFAQLPGLPSIYALLDTTPSESSEFMTSLVSRDHVLIALACALPLVVFIARPPRLAALAVRRRGWAVLASALVLGSVSVLGLARTFLYMNNPVLLVAYTVPEALLQKAAVQKLYATMPSDKAAATVAATTGPATHILIIGESTTSRHMSLYGYARDTTPRLRELAPELEIAADACSSRGSTMTQLKEMLTFATRDDSSALMTAPSLLQLMKAADFRTYWLSNQQMVGSYDNWSAVFSKPADVRSFTDRRGGNEGASYDDKLLPLLQEALADSTQRRFIVLHLMGTHHAYDLRYPKSFAQFDRLATNDVAGAQPQTINLRYNQYDNAVLYNDHIVSEIYKLAKTTSNTTVTFVSDHGEALGETSHIFGHFDGVMPRQVYEIPLVFSLDAPIKARIGRRVETFRANLAKPFQTDSLIHTLLDLYGVTHEAWRPERSLLNANYVPRQRFCDTLK